MIEFHSFRVSQDVNHSFVDQNFKNQFSSDLWDDKALKETLFKQTTLCFFCDALLIMWGLGLNLDTIHSHLFKEQEATKAVVCNLDAKQLKITI